MREIGESLVYFLFPLVLLWIVVRILKDIDR